MKTKSYTRLQKLLPIVSNFTAFVAQFGFLELSAPLEMLRLGAMKTLNIVNLVQSIHQHNILNIAWNSGFTALNLFASVDLGRQGLARREQLLSREKELFRKTSQIHSSLHKFEESTILSEFQEQELEKIKPFRRDAKRWSSHLGDPNTSFLEKQQENLGKMRTILHSQTEGLKNDFTNLSSRTLEKVPLDSYEPQQLVPGQGILDSEFQRYLRREQEPELLEKISFDLHALHQRHGDLAKDLEDSQNMIQSLQKSESTMNALRNARMLNRLNNFVTNVKDDVLWEESNKDKPAPLTKTALQSGKAFLGGL
jgi:DNA anti-recombination protein RmuC